MTLARFLRLLLPAVVALAVPVGALAAPVARPEATPERGAAPLAVSFDGSASTADPGRTISTYAWDFGDGQAATGASATHEYAASGAYTATLTVTDDLGQTSSATVAVTAQAVSLSLSTGRAIHGRAVSVSGAVVPAEPGVGVVIERDDGAGWVTVATATTAAGGAYAASFSATTGGAVRARSLDTGAVSAARPLAVVPAVSLALGRGTALLGAPLRGTVAPASYTGRVTITVLRSGRVLARAYARAGDGRLTARVPAPGVGRFAVRLSFPAAGGLSARGVALTLTSRARTLRVGSRGADVRALTRRLAALRIRTAVTSTFSYRTYDSVIAFQKTFGLRRTGVVDASVWNRLGRGGLPRAKYARPALHIEVDKSRQILMIVRSGVVSAVIPVSTGRTGNTPVGRFRILWKAPATTTWLGPAILYRTMTFYGGFAIHGYPSVPPWPASAGCVRVPMWIADWLYRQSPVGERIYIYP